MWYIMYNGQPTGPMEKEQLCSYGLSPESYVWKQGMEQWTEARNVPELTELIYNTCPPYYEPTPPRMLSGKDHLGCGLLAIFLGGLGVQYFYLGKVVGGIICILLSLITCGVWTLVMFIQGIVMVSMTQEQFDNKFVYNDSVMPIF